MLDFGGVLSAGHDPVPDVHAVLGGDREKLETALWEHRGAYDLGSIGAQEYWGRVATAAGAPGSRALLHDLARNSMRLVLLSNASVAFGEDVRRADWFEAFSFAVISAEERVAKPEASIYRIAMSVIAHDTGGVARPGDVIFFDDREENVEAARALGIDAHHWPRNGDPLPDGGRPGVEIAREVLAARGVPLD
jgi:putative hydrolase of the HAD superfamily